MNTNPYLFLVLFVSFLSAPVLAEGSAGTYPLLGVEDGDTLLLNIEGESVRVQLLGIDAPEDEDNPKFTLDLENTKMAYDELKQLGAASTAHLKSLVMVGENVSIQGSLREIDRYGRIPAVVNNAAGRPLPEAMVRDGYAIALQATKQDYSYNRRLDRLERFSRKSNNGLWGSHTESFRKWYDRTR